MTALQLLYCCAIVVSYDIDIELYDSMISCIIRIIMPVTSVVQPEGVRTWYTINSNAIIRYYREAGITPKGPTYYSRFHTDRLVALLILLSYDS